MDGIKEKEVVLDVKGLSISFKTNVGMLNAIRGVNFTLHRGETVAIVGESGSGKSVTVKAVMDFPLPDSPKTPRHSPA